MQPPLPLQTLPLSQHAESALELNLRHAEQRFAEAKQRLLDLISSSKASLPLAGTTTTDAGTSASTNVNSCATLQQHSLSAIVPPNVSSAAAETTIFSHTSTTHEPATPASPYSRSSRRSRSHHFSSLSLSLHTGPANSRNGQAGPQAVMGEFSGSDRSARSLSSNQRLTLEAVDEETHTLSGRRIRASRLPDGRTLRSVAHGDTSAFTARSGQARDLAREFQFDSYNGIGGSPHSRTRASVSRSASYAVRMGSPILNVPSDAAAVAAAESAAGAALRVSVSARSPTRSSNSNRNVRSPTRISSRSSAAAAPSASVAAPPHCATSTDRQTAPALGAMTTVVTTTMTTAKLPPAMSSSERSVNGFALRSSSHGGKTLGIASNSGK